MNTSNFESVVPNNFDIVNVLGIPGYDISISSKARSAEG